ncbi:MAG: hypothetical protein WBO49_00070 [Candidatus Saccharimonas sp.]
MTPSIIGHTTTGFSSGSGSTFSVDPSSNVVGSSVAVGDWILIVVSSDNNIAGSKTPTPPDGWVTITPWASVGSGFFTFGVWAHRRASGESTYTWSQTTIESTGSYHRMIFVRNGGDIGEWVIGSFVNRAVNASSTTTVANAVTTTLPYGLGIALSGERTTAAESDGQISCTNFTKEWFDNVQDHSLTVASAILATPGSAGSVTFTYPNTQAENGIAGMIAIPSLPPAAWLM